MSDDWYVSSAAYATYPQFQASHAYVIGNIITPTTAVQADGKRWVLRCTTAGTSSTQPVWNMADNATTTTGTATFTNITGQSAYFWTAAAGDIMSLTGQATGGAGNSRRFFSEDRIFVSSDHSESFTPQIGNLNIAYQGSGNPAVGGSFADTFFSGQILCVNRAGSTPPVPADLTTGAVVTCTTVGGNGTFWHFESAFPIYYYGMTYIYTAPPTNPATGFLFNVNSNYSHYFDNCLIQLPTAVNSAGVFMQVGGGPCALTLNNTAINFGYGGFGGFDNQSGFPLFLDWQNTTSAVQGTPPAVLFQDSGLQSPIQATLRGVDLSAVTGTLVSNSKSGCKILLDSSRISSGLVRYVGANNPGLNQADEVELYNCYDGSRIISERYTPGGTVLTETAIYLLDGAQDDVGPYSHRLDTSTPSGNIDKLVNPFCSFWLDVESIVTGRSKTATVEILSSTTLKNDEIALYLQYEGTVGSSFASFGNSFIANPLTAPTAVTASTATWSRYPATPVRQKCQVTFTPQHAGRLRGQIRVGIRTNASGVNNLIYINPQITVT